MERSAPRCGGWAATVSVGTALDSASLYPVPESARRVPLRPDLGGGPRLQPAPVRGRGPEGGCAGAAAAPHDRARACRWTCPWTCRSGLSQTKVHQ